MKKIVCFALFIFCGLQGVVYASSWPSFKVPTGLFLQGQRVIDEGGCSSNQGRMVANGVVPVSGLCGAHCPSSWNWVSAGDGRCHRLDLDFEILDLSIKHYTDSHGMTNYSEVNVRYGNAGTKEAVGSVTLTTPQDEHWYCIEKNPGARVVTCANDI